MARKRFITVRLLKDIITDPVDALKDNHCLGEIVLADAPENKKLFAGQAYHNPPKWVSFFNSEERPQLERLIGGQGAAILFVLVSGDGEDFANRWLAVCFGMGFQALRLEAQETHFGLKVALNKIGRELIKSVDTRRPEDATIQTRSQNSRTGDIFDFGIDLDRIILQSITGKCSDDAFGSTLCGSDSLKLSCDIDYNRIDEKMDQVIEAYRSDSYRDLFPWYGNITPIKDRGVVSDLDNELVRLLQVNELNNIHLAPPEIVDFQTIGMFNYSGEAVDGFDELRLGDYLGQFDDEYLVDVSRLRSDKVMIMREDQRSFYDKWQVYNCISAEIMVDGEIFVLAAGSWYEIARSFADRINADIRSISTGNVDLPPFRLGEVEGAYNDRVGTLPGFYLFDRQLVRFPGERGTVEFCDILSEDKQIIHVKKKNSSANLSHLFSQGYVSAECFLEQEAFRAQIRRAMPSAAHLISDAAPSSDEYEVIFALLHDGQPNFPFFSRVSLSMMNKQLRRMRYRVSIAWVGREGAV